MTNVLAVYLTVASKPAQLNEPSATRCTVLGALGRNDAIPRWPNGPLVPLVDQGAGTPVAKLGPLVENITLENADHLAARFAA